MFRTNKNIESMPARSTASWGLSRGFSSLPPELRLMIWTHLALKMTPDDTECLRHRVTVSSITAVYAFLVEKQPILTTKFRDEYLENFFRVTTFSPGLLESRSSARAILAYAQFSPGSKEEAEYMVAEECRVYNKGLTRWISLARAHSITTAIAPISIRIYMPSRSVWWASLPRDDKLLLDGCFRRTLFTLAKGLPKGRVSLDLIFHTSGLQCWRRQDCRIELPITIGRHHQNRQSCSQILRKHLEYFNKNAWLSETSITHWLAWHAAVTHSVEETLEYSENLSDSSPTGASTLDISALSSTEGSSIAQPAATSTTPTSTVRHIKADWDFLLTTDRFLVGLVAITCFLLLFFGAEFSI